jgi:hypothetical protein
MHENGKWNATIMLEIKLITYKMPTYIVSRWWMEVVARIMPISKQAGLDSQQAFFENLPFVHPCSLHQEKLRRGMEGTVSQNDLQFLVDHNERS